MFLSLFSEEGSFLFSKYSFHFEFFTSLHGRVWRWENPPQPLQTLLLLWALASLGDKAKSYSSPAKRSCNHRITETFQLEKIFKVIKMILFLLQKKVAFWGT